MTPEEVLPQSGGSYSRDPNTGALDPITVPAPPPAAPEQPAAPASQE